MAQKKPVVLCSVPPALFEALKREAEQEGKSIPATLVEWARNWHKLQQQQAPVNPPVSPVNPPVSPALFTVEPLESDQDDFGFSFERR